MGNSIIKHYSNIYGGQPVKVAEIGVGGCKKYIHVKPLIDSGIAALLVEPHPSSASLLGEQFANHENVEIHEVAIADYCGEAILHDADLSSYLDDVVSPFSIQRGFKPDKSHTVKCVTFDKIDPGDIDLMIIDIEGSEYFVLKHMISRPKIIQLEVGKTQETNFKTKFTNSYIEEIRQWFSDNGYEYSFYEGNDLIYTLKDQYETN